MDTKLIVALVAASASLLVAVVSLITAIITSRQSARAARSIEFLRQSIADTSKTRDFADSALVASLDALKQSMLAIQNIKDEIQLVLVAVEDSISAKEAASRLLKARDSFLTAFQTGHLNLNEMEAFAFHQTKNVTLGTMSSIQAELREHKYASQLSAASRNRLTELRTQLTEAQNVLRESRAERMLNRTLRQN